MSLLPLEAIAVYRKTFAEMIEVYGFEVELFIPKPEVIAQQESLDVYAEKPDIKGDEKFQPGIIIKTFVEWKPDTKRLRRLGIYTEDNLPIVAWFKHSDGVVRNSYIKIPINYQKGEWGTDEFELVDCLIRNVLNAVVIQAWSIAPRRK